MNNLTNIFKQRRHFFAIIHNVLKEQTIDITPKVSPHGYLFKIVIKWETLLKIYYS